MEKKTETTELQGLSRGYIGIILGLYWGYIGVILENQMEKVMENEMETGISE